MAGQQQPTGKKCYLICDFISATKLVNNNIESDDQDKSNMTHINEAHRLITDQTDFYVN